jgi:hypothetical protein
VQKPLSQGSLTIASPLEFETLWTQPGAPCAHRGLSKGTKNATRGALVQKIWRWQTNTTNKQPFIIDMYHKGYWYSQHAELFTYIKYKRCTHLIVNNTIFWL